LEFSLQKYHSPASAILSRPTSLLFLISCLFIAACSEKPSSTASSKTVLTTPQQQGLGAAKSMEQQLQQDLDRREQQMHDDGI
tara:strand:+ start:4280 stop:4528 length:249 start_codon:yes stop_codon:yes gene_type:complete